jgi:hypothetical protein
VARAGVPGRGIQRVPIPDVTVTDLRAKERTLDRTTPGDVPQGRFQPSDSLLKFLDDLTAADPPPDPELSRIPRGRTQYDLRNQTLVGITLTSR